MFYTKKYYPKRPVKSFQDLQVYQTTLGLGVVLVKRVLEDFANYPNIGRNSKSKKEILNLVKTEIGLENIIKKLIATVLKLPELIASAHSLRFGDSGQAIQALEKAMLSCNLAIVYMEEYRDLLNKKIEPDFFEEQIKAYLRVRGKIMRLQKSWAKFMRMKKEI